MQNVIISYKALGETPLECLERVRSEKGISDQIPMTYAGRLDPLAEGLMIILVGEECKNKQKYLNLDKVYEVEVLFAIQTDSYDVLGLVESTKNISFEEIDLKKYIGKFDQKYPRYSSKIISMKDKDQVLPEEMPTKEVEIYSIEKLKNRKINNKELLEQILKKIDLVNGDFRQDNIKDKWKSILGESQEFKILKIKVHCSSGTYMRSLADKIGKDIGVGAVAFSIKRVKVGKYQV